MRDWLVAPVDPCPNRGAVSALWKNEEMMNHSYRCTRQCILITCAALALATLAACEDDDVADSADASGEDVGTDGEVRSDTDAVTTGCPTHQIYDLESSNQIDLWPDMVLTRSDADSPTGLRLNPDSEQAAWLADLPSDIAGIVEGGAVASGFARSAKIVLRFDSALSNVPITVDESLESDVLILLELTEDGARRLPFETIVLEDNRDGVRLLVTPALTLKAGTEHILLATRELRDINDGCVDPSPMAAMLMANEAPSADYEEGAAHYARMIADAGYDVDELSAAVPFVTHADQQAVLAARDHAAAQSYEYSEAPTCAPEGDLIRCDGQFDAWDYRDDRIIRDGTPQQAWTLAFSVWLPADADGAVPMLFHGHGLSEDIESTRGIARRVQDLGLAVIGFETLTHGSHPTSTGGGDAAAVDFLGVLQNDLLIDGLATRGNFNQTQLDRVQLFTLLAQNPDITGDGEDDFVVDNMGYWGISFGGLHGPGTLALNEHIDAAVLSVGGGSLTDFVLENEQFTAFRPILANFLGATGVEPFLAVVQSVVDPGDPSTWAAHVLNERLYGEAPHLLVAAAEADETVPPITAWSMARALGVPQVGTVHTALPPLPVASLPISGNVNGGTAGYFQFDRTGEPPAPAGHNTPFSREALLQSGHFLETWLDGTPEIIDPYDVLGTPPLE